MACGEPEGWPPVPAGGWQMYSTTNVTLSNCPYCGNIHAGQCPRIKAIEYHENGTVKRIEFFGPVDYSPPVVQPSWPNPPYPYEWQPGAPYKITCGDTNLVGTAVASDWQQGVKVITHYG